MRNSVKIIISIIIALASVSFVGCGSEKENEKKQEQPLVYTVTFVQGGQEDIIKRVESGSTLVDIPMPVEKTGYSVSWDKTVFENITSDLTVNAVEIAKTYTVSYDLGSLAEDKYASITSATQTVTYDSSYSLYVPDCYGYDFIKWEFNSVEFKQTEGIWTTDGNVSLVAVWENDSESERWWSPFY